MKKIIILIIILIILSGCTRSNYVCSDGSTVSKLSYCPTQVEKYQEPERKYQRLVVKAIVDNDNLRFKDLESPSLFDEKIVSVRKWGCGMPYDDVYCGGVLYLYSKRDSEYEPEIIRCNVKEYYNSDYNSQLTMDLRSQTYYIDGDISVLYFEDNKKPSIVRYDYTCEGLDSGYTYTGTYSVQVEYEE